VSFVTGAAVPSAFDGPMPEGFDAHCPHQAPLAVDIRHVIERLPTAGLAHALRVQWSRGHTKHEHRNTTM